MSDIRNQLIKDSYNYVLQSDLSTGVVYRIGGDVPVNPIFQSGLTINDRFVYANGTEGVGYTLLTDGTGYAYWGPVSAATPSSGVTSVTAGFGLSGNVTTGAVTIINTAPDQTVTISGGTGIQIVSNYPNFGINYTGSTGISGEYLPLSGGTVSGNTTFTSGLTVNYIDFDTTPNVPNPTGGTLFYDTNENSLSYKPITNNNDVTVNIGMENLIRVYNNSGAQINNGQVCIITGTTGEFSTIGLAVGYGGPTEFIVDGVATHDIPNNSFGFITRFGHVHDINLSSFTNGEYLYLSQTTPGGLVQFQDLSFSGRVVQVGYVISAATNGILEVSILNESYISDITSLERNILNANNSSTGTFEFTGLTIDTPSGTTFSVAPVKGWIIDNTTTPTNPSIKYINFTGQTGITSLYYSSNTETYILLTSGLTILQHTTFPTPTQRRQNIYLGKFGHGTKQFLINAFSEPDVEISPLSQLRDMFTPIKLINDGIYPSPNGANLSFNTSAGYLWGLGINFKSSSLDPSRLAVSGNSPTTFQYRTQTGGTASNVIVIDPTKYDLNGVVTNITGTKATNQRIYLLQNGQFRVQYGQTEYNQLSAAIAAVQTEPFVTFSNFKDNAILIGILSILSTSTSLLDTTKSQFFFVSKFGETVGAAGGASTTTLQQAYDNSAEPEILINSTLDGVSIQNGTGNPDNTSQLLQGKNAAAVVTSFIRADGLISGGTLSTQGFTANTNGLTATTISATTYQNLPVSAVTSGTGISASTSNGVVTVTNTLPDQTVTISGGTGITTGGTYPNFSITNSDRGSSQNIFKNIQIAGITQFSAGSNTSNLNFSGINISITSAATNTIVFSAATGGGGGGGGSVAIYDEGNLLTSNVSSIDFVGGGVISTTVGNNVTVTIPGGLTAVTTLIASNSCIVVPNSSIYIGNSTYGWNGLTWDLDDLTFDATYSNCGIPLTKKLNPGKLNICGIAYINDSTPTTCDFTIYIYKFSCGAIEGITSLVLLASQENKNAYDRMGIKCFTLEYVLPPGDILEDCSDFIVIGFQSTSNDATQVKISYSLSSN